MVTMVIDRKQAKEIAMDLPTSKLQEVMKLRRKGFSHYDISEELDLPYPHVVAEAIKRATSYEYSDTKKFKRREEEAKLEHLYQKAYEGFQSTGTPEWFDRLMAVSARKSKLLGLDAPNEQVLTGKNGGPVQFQSLNLKGLSETELTAMEAMLSKVVTDTPAP